MYKSDLDYIGYKPLQVFNYIMELAQPGYLNLVDLFHDSGVPLIPEMPDITSAGIS